MTTDRESSNKAKAIRQGVLEARAPTANRKKKKLRTDRPYKVIYGDKSWVWHHCETQELAEKMVRKHARPELFRIEYQPRIVK